VTRLFLSWETLAVAAILMAAVWWALRPRQRVRVVIPVRAFRDDVWRTMVVKRGTPVYMDVIDHYAFDDGSDVNGVMVLKSGQRLRFETAALSQEGDVWTASWRCVEIDADGKVSGDPYETVMRLSETDDGSLLDLEYVFYRGDARSVKAWFGRLIRPLAFLSGKALIHGSLEKSGAFARYEVERGPAPLPATIAGVPLTRMSLVLLAAGAASFMWMSGLWPGVAILAILVLHELGHVLAMRAYGDRTSVFYLIPFMGGVAIGKKPLQSDWQLLIMVLAGPFAGLLTALAALGLFHLMDDDWFAGVAMIAAIINLVNLVPIPVLDGGQVMMALLRRYLPHATIHWIGIGLLMVGAAAFAWVGSTLMLVALALMAALQAAFPTPANQNTREPLSHASAVAGFLLLAALAAALLGTAWLIANGDVYPANPMRALGLGPFT
jgi:Zn-dependent protease/cbb3-type cytochrome oxidase subunit 3